MAAIILQYLIPMRVYVLTCVSVRWLSEIRLVCKLCANGKWLTLRRQVIGFVDLCNSLRYK